MEQDGSYGSYGSYGSGNGLPFYMKPVNRWWDGYRGQPVVILDDPSVRRFRELEQEIKVWSDRYPFIAELKGHSIRANPEWLVIASNYPLEELTNAARNPTFYQALFRRTDNGRRLFHFAADCYKPDTVPVDAETRQLYHRRLERLVEIVVNSNYSVCFTSVIHTEEEDLHSHKLHRDGAPIDDGIDASIHGFDAITAISSIRALLLPLQSCHYVQPIDKSAMHCNANKGCTISNPNLP